MSKLNDISTIKLELELVRENKFLRDVQENPEEFNGPTFLIKSIKRKISLIRSELELRNRL